MQATECGIITTTSDAGSEQASASAGLAKLLWLLLRDAPQIDIIQSYFASPTRYNDSFANGSRRSEGYTQATEFTENVGTFLSVLVWGIFGAVLLPLALQFTTNWRPLIYAILSLTVIRMAPVARALRGAGLRRDRVGLMGWFGPRGLASVVFTLMAYLEYTEAGRPIDTLVAAAGVGFCRIRMGGDNYYRLAQVRLTF